MINYQATTETHGLLNKIDSIDCKLGEIAKISFGVKFYQKGKGKPKQPAEIVKSHSFTHSENINTTCLKVLEGKNIDRYTLKNSSKYIEYGPWLAEPRDADLFVGKRILIRRIVGPGGLVANIVEGEYCNNSLLHTVKLSPDNIHNSESLLAILNSKLMGYYFMQKYSRQEKTFPEIRIHELKSLPIIDNLAESDRDSLSQFVSGLIELNGTDRAKADSLEQMIDELVYKLYGLSQDYIQLVEQSLS